MKFKHGSLFSGIGGFDLAAEWMGWENIFHCEINPFCKQLLKYYWPNAQTFDDIKQTDFTIFRGKLDILTGGFPCQPYSQAGKRKGKDDERHLWPEMLRAIREIQPRWIVGENVRGLVNWDAGLVFHEVQTDLEAEGYEVFPFLLPAASVNAPHERYRIWFVAYSHDFNRRSEPQKRLCAPWAWSKPNWGGSINDTNANSTGLQTERAEQQTAGLKQHRKLDGSIITYACGVGSGKSLGWQQSKQPNAHGEAGRTHADTIGTGREKFDSPGFAAKPGFVTGQNIEDWSDWPTQSPVCNGDDGLSSRLDAITFSKWRNESIKGGGNAIVPPLVHQIFKTIKQYEIDLLKPR